MSVRALKTEHRSVVVVIVYLGTVADGRRRWRRLQGAGKPVRMSMR
jgi:hypothetical protein